MKNNVISFIKKKHNEYRIRQRAERQRKYYEIRGAVIKFFEHKDLTEGNAVDIPAFMRADQILKEVIKTSKDVNFYYGKLLKYRRVSA